MSVRKSSRAPLATPTTSAIPVALSKLTSWPMRTTSPLTGRRAGDQVAEDDHDPDCTDWIVGT